MGNSTSATGWSSNRSGSSGGVDDGDDSVPSFLSSSATTAATRSAVDESREVAPTGAASSDPEEEGAGNAGSSASASSSGPSASLPQELSFVRSGGGSGSPASSSRYLPFDTLFGELPQELLSELTSFLPTPKDVFNLSLVSKSIHSSLCSAAALYGASDEVIFTATSCPKSESIPFVNHLCVDMNEIVNAHPEGSFFTSGESNLERMRERRVQACCDDLFHILCRFPAVKKLQIRYSATMGRDVVSLQDVLAVIQRVPGGLASRIVEFRVDDRPTFHNVFSRFSGLQKGKYNEGCWTDDLWMALERTFPNLEVLGLRYDAAYGKEKEVCRLEERKTGTFLSGGGEREEEEEGENSANDITEDLFSCIMSFPRIRALSVDGKSLRGDIFRWIGSSCPNLVSISWVWTCQHPFLSLDLLRDISFPNLEELSVWPTPEGWCPAQHFQPFGDTATLCELLRKFRGLRTLRIPFPGWSEECHSLPWEEEYPSLRTLVALTEMKSHPRGRYRRQQQDENEEDKAALTVWEVLPRCKALRHVEVISAKDLDAPAFVEAVDEIPDLRTIVYCAHNKETTPVEPSLILRLLLTHPRLFALTIRCSLGPTPADPSIQLGFESPVRRLLIGPFALPGAERKTSWAAIASITSRLPRLHTLGLPCCRIEYDGFVSMDFKGIEHLDLTKNTMLNLHTLNCILGTAQRLQTLNLRCGGGSGSTSGWLPTFFHYPINFDAFLRNPTLREIEISNDMRFGTKAQWSKVNPKQVGHLFQTFPKLENVVLWVSHSDRFVTDDDVERLREKYAVNRRVGVEYRTDPYWDYL